ncbi:Fic family protein [Cellulomonas sp.]|uniref:type II toxin-antitoxin system death-on-curing family toxin n=1 Tax=Cellulomonas sp. TaxID=40001 RepID=UPI001B0ECD85|nr:Fic family protein [Cellulomonas sp.]MBO9553968.1 Fic family protein [Cellulomonas sp.]
MSEQFEYPDQDDAAVLVRRLGFHVRDAGLLASALDRPRQVVWGVEAYVGLHAKAAALLDAISRAHPCIDGNKRLAWILVRRFYDLNGYVLTGSDDPVEVDRFIREVAGGHLELGSIAGWLAARTTSKR